MEVLQGQNWGCSAKGKTHTWILYIYIRIYCTVLAVLVRFTEHTTLFVTLFYL
jgi:hypothetical protein